MIKIDFQASLKTRCCPLCGSTEYTALHKEYAATDYWYTDDVFIVAICKQCGFSHAPIVPSETWLMRYKDPEWNPQLLTGDKVSQDTYEDSEILSRKAYDMALTHLDSMHVTSRSILDVGCSEGYFLVLARSRGFDVKGIDPHQLAVDRAKKEFGLDVKCGTLEADGVTFEEKFGVITLYDVAEHLQNPKATFRRAYDLLCEDAYFIVKTPNFFNKLHKIRQEVPANLSPRVLPYHSSMAWHAWDHVNYFTSESLEKMLALAGFEKHARYLVYIHYPQYKNKWIQAKAIVKLNLCGLALRLFGGFFHRWLTLFVVIQK